MSTIEERKEDEGGMGMITAEEIIQRLEKSKEISKKLEEALSKGDAPVGEHWQIGITTQLARDIINFINHTCNSVDDEEYKNTIKALEEHYINKGDRVLIKNTLDLIKHLKSDSDDLFYKLNGVMWFVDKWLDGDELEKDELNRAITMREKTLQITENQQAEIKRLKVEIGQFSDKCELCCDETRDDMVEAIQTARSEAVKDTVRRLREGVSSINIAGQKHYVISESYVDNLVKEMEGDTSED